MENTLIAQKEKCSIEKSKELFMAELKDFTKKYDFLGEVTLSEEPDIDTIDYIYSIENLNGKSVDDLFPILGEIANHMEKFSKANNIYEFYTNVCFFL